MNMKKLLILFTTIDISTISYSNLISCAVINLNTDDDSAFNDAVKQTKKNVTVNDVPGITLMTRTFTAFEPTKYFVSENTKFTVKFKIKDIATYDQLIAKYPDMANFNLKVFFTGVYGSYNLYDSKNADFILSKNGDFQYDKESTFTTNSAGFLSFSNYPWLGDDFASVLRQSIQVVNSDGVFENIYFNNIEKNITDADVWTKLYNLANKYKYTRDDVFDKTKIPDSPFLVLEGKSTIYQIEVKRLIAYLTDRSDKNYRNQSIAALVDLLDDVKNTADENYGLNEKYYGLDYKPNYKLQFSDNDAGGGLYYASNGYMSLHDGLYSKDENGQYTIADEKWTLKKGTVNDDFILNPLLSKLTNKSNDELVKDMKRKINWGLIHEVGHIYQNSTYTLNWWTEISVNINSFMSSRKFFKDTYLPTEYENAGGDWMKKWSKSPNTYLNQIKIMKENNITFAKIPTNANLSQTDLGALFLFQLMSAFGDEFMPILNHYYRVNSYDMVATQDTDRLDFLMRSISIVTKTNLIKFSDWWNVELSDTTMNLMKTFGTDNSESITNNLLYKKWYEPVTLDSGIKVLGNYYDRLKSLPGDKNTVYSNIRPWFGYGQNQENVIDSSRIHFLKQLNNDKLEFGNRIDYQLNDQIKNEYLNNSEKLKLSLRMYANNFCGFYISIVDNKLKVEANNYENSIHYNNDPEWKYFGFKLTDSSGKVKIDFSLFSSDNISKLFNAINNLAIDKTDKIELFISEPNRAHLFNENNFSYESFSQLGVKSDSTYTINF